MRAERRHAEQRKKAKARRLFTSTWLYGPDFATPRRVGMRAATMQPCSCLGCGNVRPHVGPTRRELMAKPEVPADLP